MIPNILKLVISSPKNINAKARLNAKTNEDIGYATASGQFLRT